MRKRTDFKRWVFFLNILLVCGLLVHSLIFFTINKAINPIGIVAAETEQLLSRRILWRMVAETTFAFCGAVYLIGHIIIGWISIRNGDEKPLKKILLYYVMQVFLMIVCCIPFGLMDISFLGDYVFPIWGTVGTISLILILYVVACLFARKRKEA